jgi:inosine-uridine nucleoside N-ribohydrolase
MIHRLGLVAGIALCLVLCISALRAADPAGALNGKAGKIPVILDTDIGDDIDDTWALALLLRSPELDLKLVVGDYHRALYRARLLAKFLQSAGRGDVPVGIGLGRLDTTVGGQAKWVADYDLRSYPGKVYDDGVQALIDTIMASPTPITLIAIGPAPNIAEALKREPKIATKARFVGMDGSVRLGYGGSKKPAAEWNIKADIKAAQAMFTAPWEMTITPLDTCGLVQLKGNKYKAIRDSQDPIAKLVIENYRLWCGNKPERADSASSPLFDTVAVYLAFSQDLATMERLNIRVMDDGLTAIDPQGKAMNVATSWKDLAGYEDFLVKRLTTNP